MALNCTLNTTHLSRCVLIWRGAMAQISDVLIVFFIVGIAAIFHAYTLLYTVLCPLFVLTTLFWGASLAPLVLAIVLQYWHWLHTCVQGPSSMWRHQAASVVEYNSCCRLRSKIICTFRDLNIQKTVVPLTQTRECKISFFFIPVNGIWLIIIWWNWSGPFFC